MSESMQTSQSVFRSTEGRQAILDFYEAALRTLPVAYEEKYVDTAHGRTYVIEAGAPEKPALVLLHGSTSNAAMWLADIPALAPHFRVLAVDIIGEAGHSAENRFDLNTDAYAQWLKELLDGLGVGQAAFMGNSLGGWLALALATAWPERTASLVLLASAGLVPTKRSFMLRAIWSVLRGRQGREQIYRQLFAGHPIPPEVTAFTNVVMDHFNPMMARLPEYSDEALRRLRMPVLSLAGAKDITLNAALAGRRLQNLVPQAQVRILPNTGHVIYQVLDTVLPFLRETQA
jgi:pimeloyl-ACP methyl ester carboxylesterase